MSAFIFYPERRTHQDADILFPSFLQDRCGQSWLSRATCVLLLSSPTNVEQLPSCGLFKLKREGSLRTVCALIMERLRRPLDGVCWRVSALLRTTCIHWKSTDGAPTAVAAAPHREGRPQRHAPLRLVKATSHRVGGWGELGRKGVKTNGCDASAEEVKLGI